MATKVHRSSSSGSHYDPTTILLAPLRDSQSSSNVSYPQAVPHDTLPEHGGGHLPPEKLDGFVPTRLSWSLITIFSVVANIAVIFGCSVLYRRHSTPQAVRLSNCEGTASHTAGVERAFALDAPVLENLSFSQARLIDLVWDTIIGQCGRFLHGWLLYHVIARVTTWVLEYTAMPCKDIITLSFYSTSIESLWLSCRFIAARQPVRFTLTFLWLMWAVAYVLGFATIWSVTTAYMSPGMPTYSIMDNTWVGLEDLSLCWSFDSDRLGPGVESVVLGLRLPRAFNSFGSVGLSAEFETLNLVGDKRNMEGISESFLNLYAYAMTKITVTNFLYPYRNETSSITNDLVKWPGLPGNASLGKCAPWPQSNHGVDFRCQNRINTRFPNISGFSFAGYGQRDAEYLPTPVKNTSAEAALDHQDTEFVPYNTSFYRNDTVMSQSGVLPYNSTLWWNGKRVELSAPFLKFGEHNGARCNWLNGPLDVCICQGNKPIMQNWSRDQNLRCMTGGNYIWGFAMFIVFIGLILEAVWLTSLWIVWAHVVRNSPLVGAGRSGSGVVRSIIDISEGVTRDLGSETSSYTDGELLRALENKSPWGYGMSYSEARGLEHIGLVSVPKGAKPRRRMPRNLDCTYG